MQILKLIFFFIRFEQLNFTFKKKDWFVGGCEKISSKKTNFFNNYQRFTGRRNCRLIDFRRFILFTQLFFYVKMFISIFGNDIADHDIWALKSEKVNFSLYICVWAKKSSAFFAPVFASFLALSPTRKKIIMVNDSTRAVYKCDVGSHG